MLKSLFRSAVILGLATAVLAGLQPARAAEAKTEPKHVQGQIEAVDTTANTLTIKHEKETMTFSVPADVEFGGVGKKKIALADLKVGDHVLVHYTEQAGKLIAHKIGHVNLKAKKKD